MFFTICVAVTLVGSLQSFRHADPDLQSAVAAVHGALLTPRMEARTDRVATGDAVGVGVLHFLHRIAVVSAGVAQERANSKAVRTLAETTVASHLAAQRKLMRWVSNKPSLRSLLTDTAQGPTDDELRIPMLLRKVAANRFDRTFLKTTVELTARGLRFMEVARGHVVDPALSQLLHEASVSLQRTRTRARELLERPGDKGDQSPRLYRRKPSSNADRS
jgi:hypothetical protein